MNHKQTQHYLSLWLKNYAGIQYDQLRNSMVSKKEKKITEKTSWILFFENINVK